MRKFLELPARRRHGRAAMIGLMVIVAVIMIVTLMTTLKQDPKTGKTQGQTQIGQAEDAVCAANRLAIRTNFVNWRLANPGVKPDQALIARVLHIPQCPAGGVYLFGPDDNVYCTKHAPPPAAMMSQMITLSAAQASAAAPPAGAAPAQPIVPNLNLVSPAPTP